MGLWELEAETTQQVLNMLESQMQTKTEELHEKTIWFIFMCGLATRGRVYTDICSEEQLQTVCSAGSACGNCCFSEQVSDQRGSIPLTLFESKAECDGPVQLRLTLPFSWGFIHNTNCGNNDEESIGDYALSHTVWRMEWSNAERRLG